MPNPFTSAFLPALAGDVNAAGQGAVQGKIAGQQAGLALDEAQLKKMLAQFQLAMSQRTASQPTMTSLGGGAFATQDPQTGKFSFGHAPDPYRIEQLATTRQHYEEMEKAREAQMKAHSEQFELRKQLQEQANVLNMLKVQQQKAEAEGKLDEAKRYHDQQVVWRKEHDQTQQDIATLKTKLEQGGSSPLERTQAAIFNSTWFKSLPPEQQAMEVQKMLGKGEFAGGMTVEPYSRITGQPVPKPQEAKGTGFFDRLFGGRSATAGKLPPPQTGGPPKVAPPEIREALPPAGQSKGKVLRDTTTGKKYQSTGLVWVEVP